MFWEVNRGGGLILPGAQGRALRAQNSYEALIWPYVPMKRAASARRRFLHRGFPPSLRETGKSNFLEGPVFVRHDLFTAFWRLKLEHVVGGTADLSWNYLSLDQPAPRTAPPEHMRSTHY